RDLRIDDLVANRRSVMESAGERRVFRAELKFADGVHELFREEEHFAQPHILAERYAADLVVVADRFAAADEERRAPDLRRFLRIFGDGAEDDVDVSVARSPFARFAT